MDVSIFRIVLYGNNHSLESNSITQIDYKFDQYECCRVVNIEFKKSQEVSVIEFCNTVVNMTNKAPTVKLGCCEKCGHFYFSDYNDNVW